MALQARHRYIIQRLDDAFGIGDENYIEQLIRADNGRVLDKINHFFSSDGASRIFFMFKPPSSERMAESLTQGRRDSRFGPITPNIGGALSSPGAMSAIGSPNMRSSLAGGATSAPTLPGGGELLVSDGDTLRFEGRAVYFMKTRAPPEGAKARSLAVDPSKSHDGALSFGALAAPLRSLEAALRALHLPLLRAQAPALWGRARPEHRQEFLAGLDGFVQNLQDNLKSLSGGLELRRPDPAVEARAAAAQQQGGGGGGAAGVPPALAAHYLEVLRDWCARVEGYLGDGDRNRWETADSGPDTELEYWRRRTQRLTSVTEQLRTRPCRGVLGALTAATKLPDDARVDRQQIFAEVRRWRQLDVRLTEAANEAKDNVKYLGTLERFVEPLYSGNLEAIIEILPGLMNAIKMIHTIARYFNTTERMTKLFMKITNQMIASSKLALNGRDLPAKIWDKSPPEMLRKLELVLRLNEGYQSQYRLTKDKLLTMPKGKQFDFSETQIFGKFDLFCRRVIKLIDMFSTIQQFRCLREHKLEGMEGLLARCDRAVKDFQLRGHDLLNYHSNKFDRDYVHFNAAMAECEAGLQGFIDRSFENIASIEASLQLLRKYQKLLHRDGLRQDLESKFAVIFHNYGLELAAVSDVYEACKNNPPTPRNTPPVAGKIMWARHLLKRIEDPMRRFQGNPAVLRSRESKKIVKQYNKVAQTLVAFEYTWYEAWCASVDAARAGLQATLVIQHPDTGRLYVNFDPEILQLAREAKCLARLGLRVPEAARMVLLQELKYKTYHDELRYALREYDRVTSRVAPVTAALLRPHLATLGLKLRPGLVTLTWTSMNIDAYKLDVHVGLRRLEDLVAKINDIVDNRIEKNLKVISRTVCVNLPHDASVTLDEFVTMQETATLEATEVLVAKNQEVETAVEDLIQIVTTFPLDPRVGAVPAGEVDKLREHYTNLTYRALLNCVRASLDRVKGRVCSRASHGFLFVERPFFEVDVQLSVPSVRLSPSLEDVQRAINRSATTVLGCSKRCWAWGQRGLEDDEDKVSLFDRLGRDVEVVRVCLLLTGALFGTKSQVHDYLRTFRKYDWLWKEDKEAAYRRFVAQGPGIADFEAELQKFMDVEEEIEAIPPMHNIGAFTLNTANLKHQLRQESRQWKVQYSNKVHQQAREAMFGLFEYIRVMTNKLSRDVDGLDSLRYVMNVLHEIRDRESSIELEITPILDMYQMLEVYLPGGVVDKEEMDQKSVIRQQWRKLVDYAETVTDTLSSIQGKYKKQLVLDVKEFKADVTAFRQDFEAQGPMREGLQPLEAVERLRRFKDEYQLRERKMEIYAAGEDLFALRRTPYPELTKTKKELGLMDQLYTLYLDVLGAVEGYRAVLWSDVQEHLEAMGEATGGFDARARKLPRRLKELDAYALLRQQIQDFSDALPLVQELCKSSIKPRHWRELVALLGADLPFDKEAFKLHHLLDSPLLEFKEEAEEVCSGADKQLQIESKLADIKEQWTRTAFEFNVWKGRGIPVLKTFGLVIEELEEAQLQLQSLLSMRHVTPFREDVQRKLTELSDTADTLELWVKVQLLWTSLESVFMGGDIAKQMPLEAKKFAKIDKDWAKIMARAAETQNVVQCCGNELLRNTLPVLYAELEKCQKSLEGYLEQKRGKFPRFYFVSNPVLLLILSQGSDPQQMQPYYEKVFDSISRVVHDRADKTQITQIKSITGADEETISLDKHVPAIGNIEEWLGLLCKQMQASLKTLCEYAAASCMTMGLRDFVDANCGQFALLGLQYSWTHACQDALEKCKSSKGVMAETNKQQLGVLQDLSAWCLEDLGTKMNRTKIETLVTIQVHQRDVFLEMWQRYKERKLQDANDFEWLKQARFYWRPNVEDSHGAGASMISICDVDFKYCFEYLGCKERLVVTPLTDRCYITLSQALGMYLGGAPAGPAGTGKTETTKDLGRSLGIFVVVTNCTDQQRHTDMAKIFKGLCQAGLWGCFDEFNRIELPVLSVVAQQVLAITSAKRVGARTVQFPGDSQEISLNRDVGYFITMNPGYQGRQELPENLKVLFRSVAMMVPDREIIMKVKLCSVGYQQFPELARKFDVLYRMAEQQLSNQKHYDFGLRNILSVLRTAGKTKRDWAAAHPGDPHPGQTEDMLLYRTLRDMNLSKLVAQDVPLFLSLLGDLFPACVGAQQRKDHPEMVDAIEEAIRKENLISHPSWNLKIMQLYETTLVRHGIMLTGPSGSGKSTIFKCLQEALTKVTQVAHKRVSMNPKAIRAEEMFGETDKLSGEWLDGIFASLWSKYNDRSRKDVQWIICDGPVDAIWIENLNTVLDDNKILTLANGDRIAMTDNVKLMFENEDLRNASPATVSRAGIIYVSDSDLDWEPVALAWLRRQPEPRQGFLRAYLRKYVGECGGPKATGHLFQFLQKALEPVMALTRVALAESLLALLDGLLGQVEVSASAADAEGELERLFLFAASWSVGGLLEAADQRKWDEYLRALTPNVPPKDREADVIFDFMVNHETCEWERWQRPEWAYPKRPKNLDFGALLVPTVDSEKATYLLRLMDARRRPVLLVGGSGTGKTTAALMYLHGHADPALLVKKIYFSSATTPGMFQRTVEGELDKRGGKNFGPPTGKRLTVFMDDVNMPEVNEWGDQPTLEIVRQLVETRGFYFLDKDKRGDLKSIEDFSYCAAMNHPSGGQNDVPNRLKRHFFCFNLVLPPEGSIQSIYGQMLEGRYPASKWPLEFTSRARALPRHTVALWQWVRQAMLPTPSKFHYNFNMRELSRVFTGVLRAPKESVADGVALVRLWRHECLRTFADKLTTLEDKAAFLARLDRATQDLVAGGMGPGADAAADEGEGGGGALGEALLEETFFVDFLRDDEYDEDGALVAEAPKVYEDGGGLPALRRRVQAFLRRYNEDVPGLKMDLVLFDDALRHLTRIARLLGMPRGNMLLVGVGGSGKRSLTRLASYIARHHTFQITLTKAYNFNALMDDLRALYKRAGQQGQDVTFLFTEAEIKDETFLEVLNGVLMSGEVTNLFPKDELALMAAELRPVALKEVPDFQDTPENLVKFFVDRVRQKLHVALCMSPVNPKFAERARKFPGLVNGCTIDWFLTWPPEALVAVSQGFIEKVDLVCTPQILGGITKHMGMVHRMVVESCEEYFDKMRRHVYQTPKSFLSFLESYQALYKKKLEEVGQKQQRVHVGLENLRQGAEDVEHMKVALAQEEVKLTQAEAATNAMLSKLEVSSMEAKKEADAVAVIKEGCEREAEAIGQEKAEAEADLAQAQPFVEEAERAVDSIRPNDLNELKKLPKPSDIIKLIFDCVGILKFQSLNRTEQAEITLGIGKEKKTFVFLKDSWPMMKSGMLSDARFLQGIFNFSKYEKDFINDETIELMMPYLELPGFNPAVARNASKAAEGLCTWTRAMMYYHEASKVVKPKLEALRVAEARLDAALRELGKAEAKKKACQDMQARLQADFEGQMAQKREIEGNAAATRKRMETATALIGGLAGERQRWTEDSNAFDEVKKRLVGDVAVACAFVSYCGPFNQDFRNYLVQEKFIKDLREREVPVTPGQDMVSFFVDVGVIGDWNLEGLPTDSLSIQNGLLVTRSSRFPLLVDPQGQALTWIRNHEADRLPPFGTTTLGHPKLRDQLEYAMAEGRALIVAGVEQELDPMLNPVLEKQIVVKARTKYVTLADKMCEYHDDFALYLVTRLPNPHFSPEDQAKTTMIDFTVTQKGLEEQLLGIVIQKEQRSLEEQLNSVVEEVTANTKALLQLDSILLERLSSGKGNLLDDTELINVLAATKAKVNEVNEKLVAAAEMRAGIDEKREQYRPVAARGSVLYFAIVDMSLVNCMYQTSLDQFQVLFDRAMEDAEQANLASRRVGHVIAELTRSVHAYVVRGLYEKDKLSFKVLLAVKILVTAGRLDPEDMQLFLKGGAALDRKLVRAKPLPWLPLAAWLNAVALSQGCPFFAKLPDELARDEKAWADWYEGNEPEGAALPGYEARLASSDAAVAGFRRLLLVRSLREDRTLLAVTAFIEGLEAVEVPGGKLPALGPRYVEPLTDTVETIYQGMDAATPVIYLLSAGADPTDGIENLARKKRAEAASVSMGEGQEPEALRAINAMAVNGGWVLLQNCHLGLAFMETMEELLTKLRETAHEDFRLFITSEPHPAFPIGLLQMCTKVTNEPPKGLRAGLLRSFNVIVDQDKLERVETSQWRTLLYAICFLHSVVQERRKFGPLGWCVPYEYNDGDLNACLTFLEKHLYGGPISWPTLQYMVGQCQYGGKITDELDGRLFRAYAEAWLGPGTLAPSFTFNPEAPLVRLPGDFRYAVPDCQEVDEYKAFAASFPSVDSPEVFGLHPNADLTFRNKEVHQLLRTITETQPKQGGGGGGRSKEDQVRDKATELLRLMPEDYAEDEYLSALEAMGGLGVPLNIFLMQEVQRLQAVIAKVRTMLAVVLQAIRGEVVVTADLMDAINSLFDARVPKQWMYSPAGDEISWLSPTLGLWFNGLTLRDEQDRTWLQRAPNCFWLAGFFNPQGFLTAVQQEVTRAHKADGWSLDGVVLHTEVTEFAAADAVRAPAREGVFAHGLSLDGARWSRPEQTLVESAPEQLFAPLPVVFVTAVTKAHKKNMSGDYGPYGGYECPVYKYPSRTDRYLVFMVTLASRDHRPSHWVLRGAALLLTVD